MKKQWGKTQKTCSMVLTALFVLFLTVVYIGKAINRITPKGGINETQYVEVNGQEMWISIYGKDINNPVLLYLHGGPGYQCPIYFFLAEDDLSCDPRMAELYFESINAPDKGLGYTAGGHECTMYHSGDLEHFIQQTVLDNNY